MTGCASSPDHRALPRRLRGARPRSAPFSFADGADPKVLARRACAPIIGVDFDFVVEQAEPVSDATQYFARTAARGMLVEIAGERSQA